MKEQRKARELRLLVLELVLTIVGYGLLIWVDWRIAVGVFCLHYAINSRMRAVVLEYLNMFVDNFFRGDQDETVV